MTRAVKQLMVALVLSATALGAMPALTKAQERDAVTAAQDFRQIVRHAKAKVFPAVVYIKCLRETHEEGKKVSQQVGGSGVIISPEGELVTNWHVIDQATDVRCLLSDGRAFSAEIVGSDQTNDLALVRLKLDENTDPLAYATFGDSTVLEEGDFVMAMGAPWGLNRSVSIGIVSCAKRYLDSISEYSLWIQTDAAINPGNSGGPLVNTEGQIIGINARGMSWGADGMGFAIPSETVHIVLNQLRDHGKVNWSWTGLQLQPLRDFNKNMYFEGTEGVIVAETDPESPARHSGLLAKDRIVRVNGKPVTAMTDEDLPMVHRFLGFLDKHEPAVFEVERGGEVLTLEVTPREKGDVEGQELECKRWDLAVKEINQFDNPDLFFHRKEGVFIYAVKYPGNASSSGLSSQDIILKIDGTPVGTLDDVKAIHDVAIANVDKRNRILFVVLRNGLMRQVVLDFDRDYSKE